MADDAVSIDGTDYLPVGKPNSYKDYELIYYINDVTIENEEVLVEYGAAGTATGTYEYGLQRLSVEYVNEAKEYYLYNGTGNVTQTTAENGSAFLRYTYDAFGNVTSIRAPMTVDIDDLNRYTYNGEDYDYNTGLQYLRARYYSTSTGSFISQDTYLGDLLNPLSQNRYTYTHNSPVMYDDPSGHIVLEIFVIAGLVLSTTGAGVQWAGNYMQDEAMYAANTAMAEMNVAIRRIANARDKMLSIANSDMSDQQKGTLLAEQYRIVNQQIAAMKKSCSDYQAAYKDMISGRKTEKAGKIVSASGDILITIGTLGLGSPGGLTLAKAVMWLSGIGKLGFAAGDIYDAGYDITNTTEKELILSFEQVLTVEKMIWKISLKELVTFSQRFSGDKYQ